MIRHLRSSRLLALTLLLATPAFGGAWLQALHPCPADAPWVEHGDGHHQAPAGQPEGCHCVGACSTASPAALSAATETLFSGTHAPSAVPFFPPHADAPALRPSDLLPPATAPPLG